MVNQTNATREVQYAGMGHKPHAFHSCPKSSQGICSYVRLWSTQQHTVLMNRLEGFVWMNILSSTLGYFRRVRKLAKSDNWFCNLCQFFCLSIWNSSAPAGWISWNLILEDFMKIWSLQSDTITGTFNAGLCKFVTIHRLSLLRKRNVLDNKL